MARPPKPLIDLLLSLFDNNGLRALLLKYDYPRRQELVDELPDTTIPRASYLVKAVERIQAHGIDGPSFFDVLAEQFPLKADEIARARAAYFEGPFKQQVALVVGGLRETRARLGNPEVRAALGDSGKSLEKLEQDTGRLEIYKNLHESLHQLQMVPSRRLNAAARQLSAGQPPLVVLAQYQGRLANAVRKAGTFNRLPEPMRSEEKEWIDELDAAAQAYAAALLAASIARALDALKQVRAVLRFHPFRINKNIHRTALTLPLSELTTALSQVSAAVEPENAEMIKAIRAISELQAELLARVSEHKMWQDADNNIWQAEEAFERASPRQNFAQVWPAAKSSIEPLLALLSNADWAETAADKATSVSDALANDKGSDGALEKVFYEFHAEIRHRFLEVDASLRSDCTALVSIGSPLHDILEGLRDV